SRSLQLSRGWRFFGMSRSRPESANSRSPNRWRPRHQATRGLRKATRTAVTVLCNWNDMSKNTLYRLGQYELGVRGDDPTTTVSVKGDSAQRESSSRK